MGQYFKPMIKQKGDKNWTAFNSWDFDNGAKLMEHSYIGNPFVSYIKKLILSTPTQVVWAGDYADNEKGKDGNLYDLTDEVKPKYKKVGKQTLAKMRYLVSHSKKLYVDYSKVEKDTYGYRIDPLPLLTAEGNGRGGGDYEGSNMRLIGSWARDIISVEREIPIGYAEIIPNFKEGREEDIIAIERLQGSQSV